MGFIPQLVIEETSPTNTDKFRYATIGYNEETGSMEVRRGAAWPGGKNRFKTLELARYTGIELDLVDEAEEIVSENGYKSRRYDAMRAFKRMRGIR